MGAEGVILSLGSQCAVGAFDHDLLDAISPRVHAIAPIGAGQVYAAFVVVFLILRLTRDLYSEGALSSAFVNIFIKYLSTKGKAEASELSYLVDMALILVVGRISVVGMIFRPQVINLLAP